MEEDFKIRCIEIDYPQKFMSRTHTQVLGTLMSLGLKRAKCGDILLQKTVQFYVAKEVVDFVNLNLHSIGKRKYPINRIYQ